MKEKPADVCPRCGKRFKKRAYIYCKKCRDAYRKKNQATYERRRKAGLCTKCGNVSEEGKVLCAACATKKKMYELGMARAYERWDMQELCIRCGGERDSKLKTCTPCREKHNAAKRARRRPPEPPKQRGRKPGVPSSKYEHRPNYMEYLLNRVKEKLTRGQEA